MTNKGPVYDVPAPTMAEAAEGRSPFANAGLTLWSEYMRDQIPAFFGAEFTTGAWNAGIVVIKPAKAMVLLVTLDKGALATGNHYVDHFETPSQFAWQSQTSTTRESARGRIIGGAEEGWSIHLFIRGSKARDGKAAPFRYAGPVTFAGWEGEAPISVTLQLSEPLPQHLHRVFGLG